MMMKINTDSGEKQSGQKLGCQVLKKLSMVGGGGNAQKFGQWKQRLQDETTFIMKPPQ